MKTVRIDNADKKMLWITLAVVWTLVVAVIATATAPVEIEAPAPYPEEQAVEMQNLPASDTVWVDTDYCVPADGGLLCEVDPYSLRD